MNTGLALAIRWDEEIHFLAVVREQEWFRLQHIARKILKSRPRSFDSVYTVCKLGYFGLPQYLNIYSGYEAGELIANHLGGYAFLVDYDENTISNL